VPRGRPQVAVAVLLDNFIQASAKIEQDDQDDSIRQQRAASRMRYPLDPLLEKLSKDFSDDADLSVRLLHLFKVLSHRDVLRPIAATQPVR
jgi:hypothetical protein